MSALTDLLRQVRTAAEDAIAELDDTPGLAPDTWQLISDALGSIDEAMAESIKLASEEDDS
jgi:hypothetical protein